MKFERGENKNGFEHNYRHYRGIGTVFWFYRLDGGLFPKKKS